MSDDADRRLLEIIKEAQRRNDEEMRRTQGGDQVPRPR